MGSTTLFCRAGILAALYFVNVAGNGYPSYARYPPAGPPQGYPPQNYQYCPRPIVITGPYPAYFNPDLLQGKWYIYRHSLTRRNGINRIYRVSTISKTTMEGQPNTPAATQRQSVSFYKKENDTECTILEVLGFTSYTGLQNVDAYEDNDPIITRTYYTIFLDLNQGYWVQYHCEKPNLATGYCDMPHVDVKVKQRPDEMSDRKQAEIDAMLDWLFRPYCITAQQIPKCEYTDSKPECPETEPTPDVKRKMKGLALSTP